MKLREVFSSAVLAVLVASSQAAGAGEAPAAPAPRCDAHDALRRPLFGDLHVHTSLSFDANSLGVRNLPRDAYRFARGEEVGLQPYDEAGEPLRRVRLARPLDFAAVTDHSELLGELHLCQLPGSEGYDAAVCRIYRRWPLLAYMFVASRMLNAAGPERYGFCGDGGQLCRRAGEGPWSTIRDAAEEAYDRSPACTFTSLLGYEWSGGPGGYMMHRNVIFADEKAPALPVSFLDAPTGEELWDRLEGECREAGCRFLTIPHNTNLSGGLLFSGPTASREEAERRRRYEPLLELLQHKGDSECRAGAADELCSFEKLPFARMEEQPFPHRWQEPSKLSFAREILAEGLLRRRALGVNPFRLGFIGSTDTHLGTPGLADEKDYPGHGAGGDTTRVAIPAVADALVFNPGGLAAVWAEENSREAIFAALSRRETYATSGPRIAVRLFGGFSLAENLCTQPDLVARGYGAGVPMGGELQARADSAPTFVVAATQDAGTEQWPGTPLDRLEIVKIWLDGAEPREKVVTIATSDAASDLDVATCAAPRSGAASLCASWTDRDYDAAAPALYYARVVEQPSCRWTGHLCAARGIDCGHPRTVPEELAFCCDGSTPLATRERAVTSPIWIEAAKSR